jgi:two-component system CitB family sensor kinase
MARKRWPIARQLLALQVVLLVVVLLVAATSAVLITTRRDDSEARDRVTAIAQTVALNPFVVQQVGTAHPSSALQPYAEKVRVASHTDFVVIMAPDRTRFTHPDAAQIGRPFIGNVARALQGHTFTETYTGTLGPSIRAVTPVRATDGRVIALVAVGVTVRAVRDEFLRQLPYLVTGLLVLLLIAFAGAALVSRRLRRQTRGLDADSISQMYSSYQAVLHSLREGLLVVDRAKRIGMVNDQARSLLALGPEVVGARVADVALPDSIKQMLIDGRLAHDELHLTDDRVLVVNQAPVEWEGTTFGTVVTLRDRTELEALTGELDRTKAFAEALRSQTHEAANRLHTMVVLVETGRAEDAVRYATEELALSQRLTDRVVAAVEEPALAALLLGKAAQGRERGVEVAVTEDSGVPSGVVAGPDLVTVVGNLIDNAIDAAADAPPPKQVSVSVRLDGTDLVVQVSDSGPGLPAELIPSAFTRGWSTKASTDLGGRGLGLALVRQVAQRYEGTVHAEAQETGGTRFTVRLPIPDRVRS